MKKIKVALLINEFFGGAGTGYGGYGFLARRGICQFVPNKEIQIDVLLDKNVIRHIGFKNAIKNLFFATSTKVDNVIVYRVPRFKFFRRRWLKKQNYDMYYSIELTTISRIILQSEPDKTKKLIFSIQDPRPKYEWDEIETMTLVKEPNYYDQKTYDYVHDLAAAGRIPIWNTQLHCLVKKAKDLYYLPKMPNYIYLPNPVPIDYSFNFDKHKKKNMIIYLGRLEDVKRGWLFCETAKKCPEYEFHVLGTVNKGKIGKQDIFGKYKDIKNLHLEGHVDGEKKKQFLKDAKVIMVTSIHEAVQTAQLEAMAYGAVPVSNLDPDGITSEHGIWIGDVHGDGLESVDKYANAVKKIMEDDKLRTKLAKKSIAYIRKDRDYEHWAKEVRREIKEVYEQK